MKNADPVMHEVWRAKEVNAQKHETLSAYMAYLRKQGKLRHPAGRIPAPTIEKSCLFRLKQGWVIVP